MKPSGWLPARRPRTIFAAACLQTAMTTTTLIRTRRQAYRLEPNTQTQALLAKTALHANKCDESIGLLQPLADSEGQSPQIFTCCPALINVPAKPNVPSNYRTNTTSGLKEVQDLKTHKMHADHLATDAGELARKNQLSSALDLLQQALSEDPGERPQSCPTGEN